MTKEKLVKKRKRDIWLVVIFAVLIAVFIAATIVTFSFQDEERVWITLLGVFFFILVIYSISFTAIFGVLLKQDNEKLSLIQKGVPEEDVEKKYKEIQEAKQNGTYTEDEQDETDKKQKVTTLDDIKKRKKKNIILTTIFGILAGVTFILFYEVLSRSNASDEEISDAIMWVGVVSFLLFVPSLVFVCVWGYELSQDQKKIDLVENDGIPAEQVDEYLSALRDQEKHNKMVEKQAKKAGLLVLYDEHGNAYIPSNASTKKTHTSSKHYSVFDDHEWEHDVFHDDDLRDDDIMDFMDDDY
ncbi:MAG: hypothetical protein LUD22_01700 [Coprobacillus sp.]|nr:hypothetical protein [Coprobacillus sp.]